MKDIETLVKSSLIDFQNNNLSKAGLKFFNALGFNTERQIPLSKPSRAIFKESFVFKDTRFNENKALFNEWEYVDLLFQLTEEEVKRMLPKFSSDKTVVRGYDKSIIESYLFFVIDLKNNYYSRTDLSNIIREVNKLFPMPAMIVFRHGDSITLAIINRRLRKIGADAADVLEKVSLIKDVDFKSPHRAHISILSDLSIDSLLDNYGFENFVELHYAIESAISISALNKKFYADIVYWFNHAIENIKLPSQSPKSDKHKDFTIRLIARLIFIWFLKELKVVSQDLLIPKKGNGVENTLIKPNKKGTAYYKFILQNIFFNALNKEQDFRKSAINDFDVFESYFDDPVRIKKLILDCPFLNGGLFDENDTDYVVRKSVNNAFVVSDELLIGEYGLNSLLAKYKFTIAENTPLDEEVAVDPEMLGRIFENLLAEQSEDTQEAARKNAGAFYTPRPVVSYMCKNVLLRHLDIDVIPENGKAIVHKLLETSVIDPACGSGAFPMGMLEEMMNVLDVADPDGSIWFGEMLKSKDEPFKNHIGDFIQDKQVRYVKKLGLLKNCLYGLDLLDYAVEITKLRCWLSLIVEQKVDLRKKNYNLKPLPNLDFKFYKKNSLLRTFQGEKIVELIKPFQQEDLIQKLVDLENKHFITQSDKDETKKKVKKEIDDILKGFVQQQSDKVQKEFNSVTTAINKLTTQAAKATDINKLKKKQTSLSNRLSDLAKLQDIVKDYFIETVVFPSIFNVKNDNPGFDIVIGNPPYVNVKLIDLMGKTDELIIEYGFCDDLYNHFTIRGMELLKKKGYLSYITSDTFLTIQTKENMRQLFLGLRTDKEKPLDSSQNSLFDSNLIEHTPSQQIDIYGKTESIQTELIPVKSVDRTNKSEPSYNDIGSECSLIEVINTPKAFAALVDTAIFLVQKQKPSSNSNVIYIDIRFPNEKTFRISKSEWKAINQSKNSVAGWEKVLTRVMMEIQLPLTKNDKYFLGWENSHNCKSLPIFSDKNTKVEKYSIPLSIYQRNINYAIFSPSIYNCLLYDKIVINLFPVYEKWWSKIATTKNIEKHRNEIEKELKSLKDGKITFFGLICDGGEGLTTGDNGKYVAVADDSKEALKIIEQRPIKLKTVIEKYPEIRKKYSIFKKCNDIEDYKQLINTLNEKQIRQLFDDIKAIYGLKVFGKGFLYRIIDKKEIFNVDILTQDQKENGINIKEEIYLPYDKGDRDGNRWYAVTPFYLCWNKYTVKYFKENSGKGKGKPVFRNPQFYFQTGLCITNVLNPNSEYLKARLKNKSAQDVGSKSFFDQSGLGNEYLICLLNSFLIFKLFREFLNSTVNIQINDLRQIPIIIPTKSQLKDFKTKFNKCLELKLKYFAKEIDDKEINLTLTPIEREIDRMVEELYGVN